MIDLKISIPYHKKMIAKYTELAFLVKDESKKAHYNKQRDIMRESLAGLEKLEATS